MYFRQLYEPNLAQYSYILGCQATGEALVVDPLRDIDRYVRLAEQENLRITQVTETHIHADFLSGARDLTAATGATLLLSDEGGADWQYAFPHQGLRDGDSFSVGNIRIDVLHTPGHTPEHLSFVVTDAPAGDVPGMILTGDFVFVGDVGRPDLLQLLADEPDVSAHMARRMAASLEKFRGLPDHVLVWPGHGAGSACGKALGAVPVSTVGYEKRTNWALQEQDEDVFVARLLADQPLPPRYFRNMKLWNRSGEKSGGRAVLPERLAAQHLMVLQEQGVVLVDARDKLAFAGGHIPGSLNIPGDNLLTTWAGWLLDYESPFVLLAPESAIPDLVTALYRIGLDSVVGYFPDIFYWAKASGKDLARLPQMSARELAAALEEDDAVVVVDVREPHEYREAHIPGSISLPAGRLTELMDQVPADRDVVLICVRGDRACIAASVLQRNGFENVLNLAGGIIGWQDAGFSVQ